MMMLKEIIYNQSLHLQASHHPYDHVITIWACIYYGFSVLGSSDHHQSKSMGKNDNIYIHVSFNDCIT